MKAITLSLNLNDANFSGLGRRKYTEKYTPVPVKAYPEPVTQIFTALYVLLGLELNDETASLSILASPEGFPQRLIGPKVFQIEGKLGLKVDKAFFEFEQKAGEDEIEYSLKGKKLSLQAEGKNPVFKLALGSGLAIKFPIYCNYAEDLNDGTGGYYTFTELEEALAIVDNTEVIKKIVGSPSAGGKTLFTALKYLPVGSYKVLTAKNSVGKYGATLEIIVCPEQKIEVNIQQKNPATEKWEIVLTEVEIGANLKVQGNTALKNSLMGAELVEDDNVYLDVTGQTKGEDGKIQVASFFNYEQSKLKFEF
jgi:hypothetical protein